MVTSSSIILLVVAGDLCMTSLFAVTNVMCKVAGKCLVLILAPCLCDFVLWGSHCIGKFGLFNLHQVGRHLFPGIAPTTLAHRLCGGGSHTSTCSLTSFRSSSGISSWPASCPLRGPEGASSLTSHSRLMTYLPLQPHLHSVCISSSSSVYPGSPATYFPCTPDLIHPQGPSHFAF